jgi:2-polyprenyl-3-methyl-5-hydroxy-6-metoxy-1,4-benzoquinol methylase
MSRMPPGPECNLRCDDYHSFLEIADNQGAARTILVQCNRCNLVFEEPRPSQAEIQAFYDDTRLWTDSIDAEGKPRSYVSEMTAKRPLFKDLVRRIEKRKPGGALLDIGCGSGLLELSIDRTRWHVTGIEMSEYIAAVGRDQLGTNVIAATFEEVELPAQHYDVIVLKYVLDHMEDPFAALSKARELIKSDGLLVIADLINIESFAARFFREGFRLIHPMHFTYFSPQTVSYHLQRAGFSVTEIEYPFFRTPYFNATNTGVFVSRTLKRLMSRYVTRSKHKVFSPPFYGSMMDVWAVPV